MLMLAGLFINIDGLIGGIQFGTQATQETGAGGIVSLAQGMLAFFTRLDEFMQIIGALGLLVAVVVFAVYWLLRTPTLAISVAGDGDDLHVPRPEDPDSAVTALEEAIIIDEFAEDSSGRLASVLPEDIF
jgi:hypothetical protein